MVVGGWYGKGLVPVGTILVGGLVVCAGALVWETLSVIVALGTSVTGTTGTTVALSVPF